MDFEIKSSPKIKILFDGKTYEVAKPTVKLAQKIVSETRGLSEAESLSKSVELISEMGIPKDILESLEVTQFAELVEFIFGKLKKN